VKDQLKQAIIDGNADLVNALTQALLASGATAREISRRLLPGMRWSARMRSATASSECPARAPCGRLDLLRPHLAEGESTSLGTVVIGTVKGDLHDIGKNLVGMMLQGAGFEVVNLGTGVTPAQFVASVTEHKATIIGMSALLTTTLPKMVATIAALKDAGLRATVKVMIGGAPVTQAYADEIGADGYGANAAAAVDKAKALVA
jgi:5-methyltetrahydrofolate--homocysteine methyltransferase